MCNKSNSVNFDSFEWKMYEKAIEGRNNHYSSYTAWMNLYAIFNGALFVGFYTIFNSNKILAVLICFIGILASICWLKSLSGYYSWMKSWIKVVHEYEELLNSSFVSDKEGRCYVYKVFIEDNQQKKEHYSTQKITKVFIITLIVGWSILVLYLLLSLIGTWNLRCFGPVGICLIVHFVIQTVGIIVIAIVDSKSKMLSDTKNMYNDIHGNNQ